MNNPDIILVLITQIRQNSRAWWSHSDKKKPLFLNGLELSYRLDHLTAVECVMAPERSSKLHKLTVFLDIFVTEAYLASALTNTGGEELDVVTVEIFLSRSLRM